MATCLPCTTDQGSAVQVWGDELDASVEAGDCRPVHVHVAGVVILWTNKKSLIFQTKCFCTFGPLKHKYMFVISSNN